LPPVGAVTVVLTLMLYVFILQFVQLTSLVLSVCSVQVFIRAWTSYLHYTDLVSGVDLFVQNAIFPETAFDDGV